MKLSKFRYGMGILFILSVLSLGLLAIMTLSPAQADGTPLLTPYFFPYMSKNPMLNGTPTKLPTLAPTNTATNTPMPTPTATNTATATPPDICPVQFEGHAVAGLTSVFVTGDPGTVVHIRDLTVGGTILGTDTLIAVQGHACEGFADYSAPSNLDPPLIAGHVILAENLDDGTFDTTVVLLGTPAPTNSPTPTATLIPSTPTYTPTPTNTPTITPSPTPIPNILLVVGDTNLSAADSSIRTQLAALNTNYPGQLNMVAVVGDSASQTSDANGRNLVVISASVDSVQVTNKFQTVAVPVMVMEDGILNDMGMVGGTGSSYHGNQANQTALAVVGSGHPLAAGLGNQNYNVYISSNSLVYGLAEAGAIKIATVVGDPDKAVIFAFATNAAMPAPPLTAPARRVSFFLYSGIVFSSMTAQGQLLFNASVCWAMTGAACP